MHREHIVKDGVFIPDMGLTYPQIPDERMLFPPKIREIKIDENNSVRPTVSIGIAEFPNIDEPNMTCLIECADKALYQAKNNGKNCIYEYREGEFFRCTE